jgi:hypothetical protein
MGFKGLGKASENAWFRVSERAVEIEYCRPAHHHVISIACCPGPGAFSRSRWTVRRIMETGDRL